MKLNRLKELVGKHVRLNPLAIYRDIQGERYVKSDWFVERPTENGIFLSLSSGHGFDLRGDQLHQYNEDLRGRHYGILTLTGQLYIAGDDIEFQPVIGVPGTGRPLSN
ncbi:MAG: hypothetical protein JO340_15920 [Acidobacteriaceae bacterium]|nr:hypothetical protein [Acidobacteriaceae bacterium]